MTISPSSARLTTRQIATVVQWQKGYATLYCPPIVTCQGCQQATTCQHSSMSTSSSKRTLWVVPFAEPLQIGQKVTVMIKPTRLIQAAMLTYLLPLIGLMAGSISAYCYTGKDSFALLGALVGGVTLYGLSKYISTHVINPILFAPIISLDES